MAPSSMIVAALFRMADGMRIEVASDQSQGLVSDFAVNMNQEQEESDSEPFIEVREDLCLPADRWDRQGYHLEAMPEYALDNAGECADLCASNAHKQGLCDGGSWPQSRSDICNSDCEYFTFSLRTDYPSGYIPGRDGPPGNCVLIPFSGDGLDADARCGFAWATGYPEAHLDVLRSFNTYQLSRSVSFTQTTGRCRGGPNWPGRNQPMQCVKRNGRRVQMTYDACQQECQNNQHCGAFGRQPGDLSTCCLFAAGNTGNGQVNRECFVAAR